MRKNVKKVIAPLLAAAMALSCTVCVSAAEDETIKLTVWGAEEDQNLLKELTDKLDLIDYAYDASCNQFV